MPCRSSSRACWSRDFSSRPGCARRIPRFTPISGDRSPDRALKDLSFWRPFAMTDHVACCSNTKVASERITHPLQPLTLEEIRKATSIVRAAAPYGTDTRFETIELMEPAKSDVRAFKAGDAVRRNARVNVFSSKQSGVTTLVVSLDDEAILSRTEFPDQRLMIQLEQFTVIEAIVRKDPTFIAACTKRGITDMSQVCIDPWSAGMFGFEDEAGRHLCHTFAWLRLRENENFYAHPIEGLNAVIDLK